jgi:hypothetical protein
MEIDEPLSGDEKAGRQRASSSSPLKPRGVPRRSGAAHGGGAGALPPVDEQTPSPFAAAAARSGALLAPAGSLPAGGLGGAASMDRAVSLPATLSARERMALKRKSKLSRNDSMAASLSLTPPAAAAAPAAAATEAANGGGSEGGAEAAAAAAAAQEAADAEQDEAEVRHGGPEQEG